MQVTDEVRLQNGFRLFPPSSFGCSCNGQVEVASIPSTPPTGSFAYRFSSVSRMFSRPTVAAVRCATRCRTYAEKIVMPALSPTMEAGTIANWKKKVLCTLALPISQSDPCQQIPALFLIHSSLLPWQGVAPLCAGFWPPPSHALHSQTQVESQAHCILFVLVFKLFQHPHMWG